MLTLLSPLAGLPDSTCSFDKSEARRSAPSDPWAERT
jgi:hypothetical protein